MTKDNKMFLILIGSIVVIAMMCGIFAVQKESKEVKQTDAEKMAEEYSVLNDTKEEESGSTYPTVNLLEDNLFIYKTEDEIVDILQNKTALIYFGFPTCPWCRTLVPILEEVGEEKDLSAIYYVNIKDMRDTMELDSEGNVVVASDGSPDYYKILEKLDAYLPEYELTDNDGKKVDTGEKRLYAPTIVTVSNGEVTGYHKGTVDSQKTGFETLSDADRKSLKETITKMVQSMNDGICTEGC